MAAEGAAPESHAPESHVSESLGAETGTAALERRLEMDRHERLVIVKAGAALVPFTTDGCSGGLSVGWALLAAQVPRFAEAHGTRPPWEHCCVAHDRAYHAAGPPEASAAQSYNARLEADRALQSCVRLFGETRAAALGAHYGVSEAQVVVLYGRIAELMFLAVRLGGTPCTGLPWRWGYGWPECG
jgi:hypothetical protein